MAGKSGNARLLVVVAVAAFLGGCWVGMGSDSSGEAYCVVTDASEPARPGLAAGQLADKPVTGCLPSEPEVCGRFEGADEDRRFVSDVCPEDD